MYTSKKRNKIREPSITCSQFWHFDKLKCVHWLDRQSVKVLRRYDTDMNRQLCMKILKNATISRDAP